MKIQLLVPEEISIVNRSSAVTVSGEEVRLVKVLSVPEDVPAATVLEEEKTATPFCLIVKVRAVAPSEAFVTTLHLVKVPFLAAIRIGPTPVPVAPEFMTNPMVIGGYAHAAALELVAIGVIPTEGVPVTVMPPILVALMVPDPDTSKLAPVPITIAAVLLVEPVIAEKARLEVAEAEIE